MLLRLDPLPVTPEEADAPPIAVPLDMAEKVEEVEASPTCPSVPRLPQK